MNRIPDVLFPYDIDSEYSLFKVYNNSQSVLTEDITSEATEIKIQAASANTAEVWPSSGFVTIQDELIYYDNSELNEDGKICVFKRCKRGLEGIALSYQAGTSVYGNVVANQHNQLAAAIIEIEKTIGNISELVHKPDLDEEFPLSLHGSLAAMQSYAAVGDDSCPDVEFEVNTGLPVAGGTTMEFCVRIYGQNVNVTSYKLDFGDGTITTTQYSGTHQYSSGGPFNPVVTVITPQCTIIQQPSNPDAGCSIIPTVSPSQPFHIPIPSVPNWPSFVAPQKQCPGPLFNLPPILVPNPTLCSSTTPMSVVCGSISAISVNISITPIPSVISLVGCCPPSLISVVNCTMPSLISITGCCPPSVISFANCNLPSVISFAGNCCSIPSVISVQCCSTPIPSVISVQGCNFPNVISVQCCSVTFAPTPSFAPIQFANPPSLSPISVVWGVPPTVSCVVTVACPASSTPSPSPTPFAPNIFGDFQDGFNDTAEVPLNVDLGIPKEIKMIAPTIPDINIIHDIPKEISIKVPTIPDIRIIGPETNIPSIISIIGNIPSEIKVASDIPKVIHIEAKDIPSRILVESNLPSVIRLEAFGIPDKLQVVGIPPTIEITNFPSEIQLVMPPDPTIELVYKGSPFELGLKPEVEKLISQFILVHPGS